MSAKKKGENRERRQSHNPPKRRFKLKIQAITLLTKMVRESASSIGGPVIRKPACTKCLDKGSTLIACQRCK